MAATATEAPTLDLVGVECFEGQVMDPARLAEMIGDVDAPRDRARPGSRRAAPRPIASAGGSAFFDRVLACLPRPEWRVVLRSGCDVSQDGGVSEAIDFAHYYAERGRALERVDGARFAPARLTVVTPPWNFPVAIPAGSTLAALAAGSPVIIKPAAQAARCGAVMVEALWEAGAPRDVLQYVQLEERELGRRLIASPGVERVILTGS